MSDCEGPWDVHADEDDIVDRIVSASESSEQPLNDRTCEGSVGPLNDRTCEACGLKYSSEEPPKHPHLCPYCATVIDRNTKAREEEEPFNWFE